MTKVVFVCSGNICRSAMAAAYARHRAAESGLDDLIVESGGTLGIEGAEASPEAIQAMAEIGVDLHGHRSRGLDAELVEHCTLAVGMTWDHLDALAHRFAEGDEQRVLLRAFEHGPRLDPNPQELEDPIGHPVEFYRAQLPLISRCVDHLLDYVQTHTAPGSPARDAG